MMGETGPMGLHSKGRKTDMKTAAKRERKTLRIVELALLLGAAAGLAAARHTNARLEQTLEK